MGGRSGKRVRTRRPSTDFVKQYGSTAKVEKPTLTKQIGVLQAQLYTAIDNHDLAQRRLAQVLNAEQLCDRYLGMLTHFEQGIEKMRKALSCLDALLAELARRKLPGLDDDK